MLSAASRRTTESTTGPTLRSTTQVAASRCRVFRNRIGPYPTACPDPESPPPALSCPLMHLLMPELERNGWPEAHCPLWRGARCSLYRSTVRRRVGGTAIGSGFLGRAQVQLYRGSRSLCARTRLPPLTRTATGPYLGMAVPRPSDGAAAGNRTAVGTGAGSLELLGSDRTEPPSLGDHPGLAGSSRCRARS